MGGDVQVGSVKAGGEDVGAAHVERRQYVVAGARVGGGRQGDTGDAGEDLREAFEVAVFRAELMAPGADAMGLVDGDERQVAAAQAFQ